MKVTHDTTRLDFPNTGGFNNPQFNFYKSPYGYDILRVFDRDGNIWHKFTRGEMQTYWTYKQDGFANSFDRWSEAEYWTAVPKPGCDTTEYLFTTTGEFYIRVFEINRDDNLEPVMDTLKYFDGQEMVPIYVNSIDIPAFLDLENDGDLDVLTFAPLGGTMEWFQNQSGSCNEFHLIKADECWGEFYESGVEKAVELDTCPPGIMGGATGGPLHAGSTIMPIDFDQNGRIDVALGDLNFNNINLLLNDGTPTNAHIFDQDIDFPSNSVPIDILQFPASFLFDVNADGIDDLVAAPNSVNNNYDVNNVWYYENEADSSGYDFMLKQKDLFSGNTIDWGSYSAPAFFDFNGKHLILAIGQRKDESGEHPARLLRYELKNQGFTSIEIELADSNFGEIAKYDFTDISVDFADWDDDGKPEMILGNGEGKLFSSEIGYDGNDLTVSLLVPFSPAIDIGNDARPALGDLNGDGLMDMLVGERNGNLNYFENKGTATSPSFSQNPDDDFYGEIDSREPGQITGYSAPALYGTDLLVGGLNGKISWYEIDPSNPGKKLEKLPDNGNRNINDVFVGANATPAMAMLYDDANNVPDLITGNSRGGLTIYSGISPLGLDYQNEWLNFQIQPNPASTRISIKTSVPGLNSYVVIDMQGKTQFSGSLEGDSKIIDVRHLSPGAYLLILRGNEKTGRQLFIKN